MANNHASNPEKLVPPKIIVNGENAQRYTSHADPPVVNSQPDRPEQLHQSKEAQQPGKPKNLEQHLRKSAIDSADWGNKRFWPYPVLKQCMSHERICKELNICKSKPSSRLRDKDIESLAITIRTQYLKIFAILILLRKGQYIGDFIDQEMHDNLLPFTSSLQNGDCLVYAGEDPQLVQGCHDDDDDWSTADRESLVREQYSFIPVIMEMDKDGKNILHKVLDDKWVLPFLYKKELQQGGYGVVSSVKIHEDCHRFKGILPSIKTDGNFALKESNGATKEQREKDFEIEVSNLKKFNGFYHPHLVTLLMTWDDKYKKYLLFPLANYDLDRYWLEHPNPVPDTSSLQWLSGQVLGITSAVEKIHNPPASALTVPGQEGYGRHGDLKPENILWYNTPEEEKGIFIIADLGLAAFNSIFSRSNVPNGKVQCTPKYKPPEMDLEGGKISRSFDIWSLGCILLELACWALRGQAARDDLQEALTTPYVTGVCSDKYFDIEKKVGGGYVVLVKKQVNECIAKLHNDSKCSDYFHELLDLVENQMIVCLSSSTNRITSTELKKKMEEMHRKVLNDAPNYIEKYRPERRMAQHALPVDAQFNLDSFLRVKKNKVHLSTHEGPTQRSKSIDELKREP